MDLNSLLICLDGLNARQIEEIGRTEYGRAYITNGDHGVQKTHDGQVVIFWENRFDHAFFTTRDRYMHADDKSVLAQDRIARLKWIGGLIAGCVSDSECWEVRKPGEKLTKRLYVIRAVPYVAWLNPRNGGGWTFSSAYPTNYGSLREYCKHARRTWKCNKNAP